MTDMKRLLLTVSVSLLWVLFLAACLIANLSFPHVALANVLAAASVGNELDIERVSFLLVAAAGIGGGVLAGLIARYRQRQ